LTANNFNRYRSENLILPLEFKLANGTKSIKFATSVTFNIRESTVISEDIPYIYGEYRTVHGGNLGWVSVSELKVSYAVMNESRCTEPLEISEAPLKTIMPERDVSDGFHYEPSPVRPTPVGCSKRWRRSPIWHRRCSR
jgi:hypothetical protein